VKFLRPYVKEGEQKSLHTQFDPTRTLVFLDPPKEFPSRVAMMMFLDTAGNEAIKSEFDRLEGVQQQREEVLEASTPVSEARHEPFGR